MACRFLLGPSSEFELLKLPALFELLVEGLPVFIRLRVALWRPRRTYRVLRSLLRLLAGVKPFPRVSVGVTALAGVVLCSHFTAVLVRLAVLASTLRLLLLWVMVSLLQVLTGVPLTPIETQGTIS